MIKYNKSCTNLIKKLSVIYKQGYIPSRSDEIYNSYAKYANCFAHACFNLTNHLINTSGITIREAQNAFSNFGNIKLGATKNLSTDIVFDALMGIVKQVGLEYKQCSLDEILKSNEWKVSFYMCRDKTATDVGYDFHFLLQDKDGSWNGKCGYLNDVSKTELKETIHLQNGLSYKFVGVYKITNPYAKIKENNKNEEEKE